jgi:hypothetical protein
MLRHPINDLILFTVALIVALLFVSACGDKAVQNHARALSVARTVLNQAADSAEDACTEAIENAPASHEVHQGIIRRCRQYDHAHAAAVESWGLWVDLVLVGSSGEKFRTNEALQIARSVVRLYLASVQIAEGFDAELPDVPLMLRQLIGSDP